MEQLINKGDILQSTRTTKELKCYNIGCVFIGADNRILRFEYNFWDGSHFKAIKQNKLKEMLAGTWSVKQINT